MNFIYSFRKKPKNIFIIHGEEESQDVLKAKIEEETGISAIIPEFGEIFELNNEEIKLTGKLQVKVPQSLRKEVLVRLNKIKDELKDMETSVTEDMGDKKLKDEDIFRINEKIKELEKQILNVIEG